jgi:predicted histone-like DNA-binding protein
MSVKYILVERGNPGDPNAPKKFYPMAKSSGKTTLRQLSKKIADISTVSSIDVMAVLEALLQVVPEELAEGNIVKLGELGSFSIKVKGDGAETADDFNSTMITKASMRFSPGKIVKNTLKTLDYEKLNQ